MSFEQLAKDYIDKIFPRLASSTQYQRRNHIERIILPKFRGLAARDITSADVVALIEKIGKRSQSVAELVFTALSEIFNHGLARQVVMANPCAVLTLSAIIGKAEPKRKRLMLTGQELGALFEELPTIGQQNMFAVKILLATCVRINELARAEWSQVDLNKGEWVIPDNHSKTRHGFIIPLTAPVVDWFSELHKLSCGSRYVLPARQTRRIRNHGGDIHFNQRAVNSMLHKLCITLGERCRRFTPHDLRSTARSHLSALGVGIIVAERCLNHSLGGLAAIYDHHDYLDERRSALELWTNLLLECGANKKSDATSLKKLSEHIRAKK